MVTHQADDQVLHQSVRVEVVVLTIHGGAANRVPPGLLDDPTEHRIEGVSGSHTKAHGRRIGTKWPWPLGVQPVVLGQR